MENTNTNITKAAEAEKKARLVKFFIFLAVFVGAFTLLGMTISLIVTKKIVLTSVLHGMVSDLVLGSIIGYFVFLRKKKSEKSESAA